MEFLNKFPSTLILGKYNASILRLMWEKNNPVRLSSELHLTEYSLLDFWTNESVVRGDIENMRLGGGRCNVNFLCLWRLNFLGTISSNTYWPMNVIVSAGNYSALKFTFKLGREVGYYLMDYFIPSMMIVAMSWVTFWLQADASAPRITLGTENITRLTKYSVSRIGKTKIFITCFVSF